MEQTEIEFMLIVSTVIAVTIIAIVLTLFLVFQKRKSQLVQEKKETEQKLSQEIAKAQIEIKETTLRNISWELHDNIGQLLSVAKIQLNHINASQEEKQEVNTTISKSIQELRALSRISNPEHLRRIDLIEALEEETNRFNRLNFIASTLLVKGDRYDLDKDKSLIVFRMIQEFSSNAIKHARATQLHVTLDFQENFLYISVSDNGIGFDLKKISTKGIGLSNIKNRAQLIHAETRLTSEINKGTQLIIKIPQNNEKNYRNS